MRPDRGRLTLYGWWAPVALRYIKRWGPAARGTRFAVSRKPHRQTLDRSKRARSQRREAPLTLPSSLLRCPSALHRRPCNLYSTRRCPCAASITEAEMASSTATPPEGSGSTPAPLSFLPLSACSSSSCSTANRPRSTLVDPQKFNNGTRAKV